MSMTAMTATMTATMTAKAQYFLGDDRNDSKILLAPCACV